MEGSAWRKAQGWEAGRKSGEQAVTLSSAWRLVAERGLGSNGRNGRNGNLCPDCGGPGTPSSETWKSCRQRASSESGAHHIWVAGERAGGKVGPPEAASGTGRSPEPAGA